MPEGRRLGVILLQEPPGSDCSVVIQDPLLIFRFEKMFPTQQLIVTFLGDWRVR